MAEDDNNNQGLSDDAVLRIFEELGIDFDAHEEGEILGGYVAAERQVQVVPEDVPGGGVMDLFARQARVPAAQAPDSPVPYRTKDALEELEGMNTEKLGRFQSQLVATGLATRVAPGRIDDQTLKGMTSLMVMGNRQGVTWGTVLDGIVNAGGLTEEGRQAAQEFEPEPYLKPDYADLSQKVKAMFRQELGREPDQYELQQLTDELAGFDRMAYEREQELNRLRHEQQTQEGVQPGGEVQDVDPMGRFRQAFEKRYSGEIDFIEDKKEAQVADQSIQGGIANLSQASAGGR